MNQILIGLKPQSHYHNLTATQRVLVSPQNGTEQMLVVVRIITIGGEGDICWIMNQIVIGFKHQSNCLNLTATPSPARRKAGSQAKCGKP